MYIGDREEIIVCGKCGTESENLWCATCWEVMAHFERAKPVPCVRCLYCDYPEADYIIQSGNYCTGCGIRYGVKLIPVPKKKKKKRRVPAVIGIPDTYPDVDTSAATARYYPSTTAATADVDGYITYGFAYTASGTAADI